MSRTPDSTGRQVTRNPPQPSSTVGTPSQLRRELAELHDWAGKPSARRLSGAAANLGLTLARSTTQDQINRARLGTGLPTRDFVTAFVSACLAHAGLPAEQLADETKKWDAAWLAVVSAHGQVPITPGANGNPSPRQPKQSHYRMILRATGVIMTIGAAVLVTYAVTRDNSLPDDHVQDIRCVSDGLTTTWQNHHSNLYLTVRESTSFVVKRATNATVNGCVHKLLTPDGRCLGVPANANAPLDTDCADTPAQQWVLDDHWYHEDVMWIRLRPASNLGLCLQQQPDAASSSIRASLRPCDHDWIQQWHMRPDGTPGR
jgi:hypothetical protein